MSTSQEHERNHAAYHRIKKTIDETHPRGWFVAIADDQVVAAAVDFHELEGMLRIDGRDPRSVLVVEAGVDYPEEVTIFI
jgi:hypothetical protein